VGSCGDKNQAGAERTQYLLTGPKVSTTKRAWDCGDWRARLLPLWSSCLWDYFSLDPLEITGL